MNMMLNFQNFDDVLDELQQLDDMLNQLSEVDLKEFSGKGLEFNFSAVCNDGEVEVGLNYHDTAGNNINTNRSGNDLGEVVDNCMMDIILSLMPEEKEKEAPQVDKDAYIKELEEKVKELEVQLEAQIAKLQKTENKKAIPLN